MPRVPTVVGVDGPLAGRRFPVPGTGLRIGREPQNEVFLDEAGVSREHARVVLHQGAVWLQDNGSRNGVFVNGQRVPDQRKLAVGDRITVGAHVFTFDLDDVPESPPPMPTPVPDTPPAQRGLAVLLGLGAGLLLVVLGAAVAWGLVR